MRVKMQRCQPPAAAADPVRGPARFGRSLRPPPRVGLGPRNNRPPLTLSPCGCRGIWRKVRSLIGVPALGVSSRGLASMEDGRGLRQSRRAAERAMVLGGVAVAGGLGQTLWRVWAPRLRRSGCDFRRRGGRRVAQAGGAESGVGRRRSAIRILGAGLGWAWRGADPQKPARGEAEPRS
jgi:hypothetical protein